MIAGSGTHYIYIYTWQAEEEEEEGALEINVFWRSCGSKVATAMYVPITYT